MDVTNTKSTTWFDPFPTEITFLIFDYLSNNDIIYTFFFLSERITDLLLENKRYITYLKLPTTNVKTWENILSIISARIESLNINSIDMTFSLTCFSNLKSLIISCPYGFPDEELKLIFASEQFESLHSFRILETEVGCGSNSHLYDYYPSQDYVFKKIFNKKNSLKTFEYLLKTSPLVISNTNIFETNFNLHSLTLLLKDFEDIYSLLSYTPNLEYLYLLSEPPYRRIRISPSKISIKLKKLCLRLDCKERTDDIRFWYEDIDLNQLTNFIKEFSSSLICLSLDLNEIQNKTDDIPLNHIKLKELLEIMKNLQKFHLRAYVADNEIDKNLVLSKFNDPFWSDHNWSFGMNEYVFFTLPYQFDDFERIYEGYNDMKSENPEILTNIPDLWSSVKSISLPFQSKYDFNFLKELQIKLPKLNKISLYNDSDYSDQLEHSYEEHNICLDTVTTVHLDWLTRTKIQNWLIFLLPNVKHLILDADEEMSSIENELIPILNNKIQQLDIKMGSIDDRFEQFIKIIYIYFSNIQYTHFKSTEFYGISEKGTNLITEIWKNLKNLQLLLIYNLETTEYNNKSWNKFTEYLNMDEIRNMCRVKIFERYVLFSKYY